MKWQRSRKISFAIGLTLVFQVLILPGITNTNPLADEKQLTAVTEPWPPYMGPRLLDKGFLPEVLVAAYDL